MSANASRKIPGISRAGERLFGWFASLQLAIFIAVSLIAALATGAWVESRVGTAAAKAHVYQSPVFLALLTLLAINVMAAAVIRFPWKRHQYGFVITHIGIELLLAGALIGSRYGLDAQLRLVKGQTASTVQLEEDELLVSEPGADGSPMGYAIPLRLWPVTDWHGRWPERRSVRLRGPSDTRMSVIGWLPSARPASSGDGFIAAPVLPTELPQATHALHLSIDFHGQHFDRWVAGNTLLTVEVDGSPLRIAYAPAEAQLPCRVSLTDLRRLDSKPGEPVGYAADLQFIAPGGNISIQTVRVNEPASFGGISVYSGSVDEHDPSAVAAVLSVRADPGRLLKYLGGGLIVAGTFSLFIARSAYRRAAEGSERSAVLVDGAMEVEAAELSAARV